MRHEDEGGSDGESLPLAEETVSIGRREVVTGKVRVTTRVETQEQWLNADLTDEHVEITRVPVDRVVEEAPAIRTEGDLTVIPIVEEVAVIETRLVLREELHLRRVREQRTETVPVTLRRQRAAVERVAPGDPPPSAAPSEKDPPP